MRPAIRPACESDADFLAWAILASQRGHVERGWLDIALGRSEPDTLAFTRRLTLSRMQPWWHKPKFLVAETGGVAVATLCALPAAEATEHVATRPDHRGRGMALALFAHALAAGKNNGCTKAQITFLIGNDPVEGGCLKADFRFADERQALGFESLTAAPGFKRYE